MADPHAGVPSGQPRFWIAAFAAMAMLIGMTALAGWIWNVEALKSVIPGLVAMKANTAIGLVCLGASLCLLAARDERKILRLAGSGMAGLILVLALLSLVEELFGLDLRIDQLIFQEPAGTAFTTHPGRMSYMTAVQFILLASALLLLHARRALSSARILAITAGAMALLMIGRYLLGNPGLLVGTATPPALNTALAFLMLASGAVAATMDRDFIMRIRQHIPMIGMGIATILLLVAIPASLLNILRMHESFSMVTTTQEERLHLETTQSLLSHVDENIRGFLLDHDEEFLLSMMDHRERVAQEIPILQELMKKNPALREHLEMLRQLIADRMEKVDAALRIYRETGNDSAITQLVSGPIDRLVADIDGHIADMNRIIADLLVRRQAAADTITNSSLATSGILGLFGIFLMAAMVMLGRRLNAVLERMVSRRTAELSQKNRDLRLLSDCNQTLIRATDEMLLTQDICNLIVNEGGYKLCWIGYAMADEARSIRPVAQSGFDRDYLQNLPLSWADNALKHCPTGTAIRTRKPSISQDISADPAYANWRAEALRHGYSSSAALPLLAGESVMGAITIYAESPDSFNAEELSLLTEMANDLAFGISTLRDRISLRNSNMRYNALSNSLNDVVWTALPDGATLLDINDSFERIYGHAQQELKENPKLWLDAVHPDDREICLRSMEQLEKNGKTSAEYRIIRPDGTIRWLLDRKLFICDAQGKRIQLGGVATDITERKQAEEALRTTYELLDKANRAKAEFLARMSHELRTPLNAIMGFSEVIADGRFGAQSPKYPEYAKDIRRSSEHLLSLINDVLDLSKIEAGKLVLSRKPVDAAPIIGECVQIVDIMAGAKKIRVIPDVAPDLPALNADARALKQVLFNLLSNAIKFTPDGGQVEIMARATENPETIRIDIRDTGIGIAPDMLDRVFEPFGQGDSMITPAFGGIGLGLSISRNLVEMHGGTLTLESTPGQGTTVHMTLPV